MHDQQSRFIDSMPTPRMPLAFTGIYPCLYMPFPLPMPSNSLGCDDHSCRPFHSIDPTKATDSETHTTPTAPHIHPGTAYRAPSEDHPMRVEGRGCDRAAAVVVREMREGVGTGWGGFEDGQGAVVCCCCCGGGGGHGVEVEGVG